MLRVFIVAGVVLVITVPAAIVATRVTRARLPFVTGPGWVHYDGPYQFGDAASRKAYRDNVQGVHISCDGGRTISDPAVGDPQGEYSWGPGQ
jgi:hypothetical protein